MPVGSEHTVYLTVIIFEKKKQQMDTEKGCMYVCVSVPKRLVRTFMINEKSCKNV